MSFVHRIRVLDITLHPPTKKRYFYTWSLGELKVGSLSRVWRVRIPRWTFSTLFPPTSSSPANLSVLNRQSSRSTTRWELPAAAWRCDSVKQFMYPWPQNLERAGRIELVISRERIRSLNKYFFNNIPLLSNSNMHNKSWIVCLILQ